MLSNSPQFRAAAAGEVAALVAQALHEAQTVVDGLAPRLRDAEQFGHPPKGQADAPSALSDARAEGVTVERASIPPQGADPVVVGAWWAALDVSVRARLIRDLPAVIGSPGQPPKAAAPGQADNPALYLLGFDTRAQTGRSCNSRRIRRASPTRALLQPRSRDRRQPEVPARKVVSADTRKWGRRRRGGGSRTGRAAAAPPARRRLRNGSTSPVPAPEAGGR
jgi:hypothetical protein